MKIEKISHWLTIVGNLGLLVGVVLIIVQINQNSHLVREQVTAPPAKPGASEECEPLKAALRNRKRFLCAP